MSAIRGTFHTVPDDIDAYFHAIEEDREQRLYVERLGLELCHHGVSLTAECRPCGEEVGIS